jgi:hypothetical protein
MEEVLDAFTIMKEWEDHVRRTTRDLRTQVAKFLEVDCGIFENVL